MTEEEWLAWDDPGPMMAFLQDRASDRKARLFACAYRRSLAPCLGQRGGPPDAQTDAEVDAALKAVEVAERFADGRAGARELACAHEPLVSGRIYTDPPPPV